MADSKPIQLPRLSHNWADAKKFNAQRIRQRRKEEAGNLYAKDEQRRSLCNPSNQQDNSHPSSTRPALAISVTMSEDEETEVQNIPERSLSDNDTTNTSAWAMMEHYEFSRDGLSNKLANLTDSLIGNTIESESESASFRISEIEDTAELNLGIPQKEHVVLRSVTPSETAAIIKWQENDEGELVEQSINDDSSSSQSVASSHVDNTSSIHEIVLHKGVTLGNNGTYLNKRNDQCGDDDQPCIDSRLDTSQSTALCVRQDCEQSLQNLSSSSSVSKLFVQESIFQSICDSSDRLGEFHEDGVRHCDESTTSIYVGGVSAPSIQSSVVVTDDAAKMKQNFKNINNKRNLYVSKIEELEKNLKDQKMSTAMVQSKLKDRVVELEQALRVTAATPRGTIIQENPLKTLLDRNQTLVKEVRFADQTCVELSSRINSLKMENKTLLERVECLEQENVRLRNDSRQIELTADANEKQGNNEVDLNQLDADPKMESSISVSSDILSVEMLRVRGENDFLGKQLGSVQKQLDTKHRELEEERKKSKLYEDQLAGGIQTSERGQASSFDVSTKHQLIFFKQELLREKTTVSSLRQELENIRMRHQHDTVHSDSKVDSETTKFVSEALGQIHGRYTSLESHVLTTFDVYITRLEDLTKKVEILKSSLLFEIEPQLTKSNERQSKMMVGENVLSTNSTNNNDVLELMEEARIPAHSHIEFNEDDDSSINFEDISNFVFDDDTLGSITKNRSMITEEGHTRWKEQLEAVLTECNRVKKRSTELRDEIFQQKSTIKTLEAENGKLSLQSSRKGEEIHMVEQALFEAKQVIGGLEQKLIDAEKSRDIAIKSNEETAEKIVSLEKIIQHADSDCAMEQAKRQVLEKRIAELQLCLLENEKMLSEATQTSLTHKLNSERLGAELQKTQEEVHEKKDFEVSSLQCSLREANECIEDLKTRRQEAIDELSQIGKICASQRTQIDELQSQKKKIVSEVEDSILDSQCSLEEMRRERAELRSRLSKREGELKQLKEMYAKYKETSQMQLDKRLKVVQGLQAEKEETLLHCKKLQMMRQDFFGLMKSFEFYDSLVKELATKQSDGLQKKDSFSFKNELSCWQDLVQKIGSLLRSTPKLYQDCSDAVEKVAVLSNDLTMQNKIESEYKNLLAEGKKENEKLCSLLRQAEFEMERSALQIQEMSAALSNLQRNEAELSERVRVSEAQFSSCSEKLVSLQNEVSIERNDIQQNELELERTLEEQQSRLVKTTAELSATKSELKEAIESHQSQARALTSLEEKLSASESKCTRLREYIHKLTKKCEEWEKSYDKQSRCIDKLRQRNVKVLDKASDIAKKYRKLKTDVQRKQKCHTNDREKWTREQSNIQAVHMQLEEELDLIAKELHAS